MALKRLSFLIKDWQQPRSSLFAAGIFQWAEPTSLLRILLTGKIGRLSLVIRFEIYDAIDVMNI